MTELQTKIQEQLESKFVFPDGVYSVLPTPFNDDDTIDYTSLKKLLWTQWIWEHRDPLVWESSVTDKIVGIVLMGTTSESPTLEYDEKIQLLEFVAKFNSERGIKKKIVVGVGGNNTKHVVEFAKKVSPLCDALMVTVPYYNRPQQRGIVDLFVQVSDACPDKPIIAYNIPGRTGLNMEPETIHEVLTKCPNVTALKEASGDWVKVAKLCELIKSSKVRVIGDSFKLFSGDDANMHTLMMDHGGSGVISVASNVIPSAMCRLYERIEKICKGELEKKCADTYISCIGVFAKYLFAESNPVPVKDLLKNKCIFKNNTVRRPLMEMNDPELSHRLHVLCFRDMDIKMGPHWNYTHEAHEQLSKKKEDRAEPFKNL